MRVPADDELLRLALSRPAEALAKAGVSTLVTGAIGSDPAGWLESTFSPAMERLREIRPHVPA